MLFLIGFIILGSKECVDKSNEALDKKGVTNEANHAEKCNFDGKLWTLLLHFYPP